MGTGTEEGRAARHGSTAALKRRTDRAHQHADHAGTANESTSVITEESYYYESVKGLRGTGRSGKLPRGITGNVTE